MPAPTPVSLTGAQASALTDGMQRHAAAMERTNARIDAFNETVDTVEQNIDKLLANGSLPGVRGAAGGPSVAREFVASEQFAAFRNGAVSTGQVTIPAGIAGLRNATTLTSDGGGYGTGTQWDGRMGNAPIRRLQLLDALPVLQVETGAFAFNQLDGYVNAAAVQATQGSAKAQGSIPAVLQTANIATVAHWIKLSQQVMQDSGQLQKQLTTLLAFGVREKLSDLVLNGTGGTGNILGLLSQATTYAATSTSTIDKIGEAAAHLASIGYQASVVALSPADWWAMAEAKSSGSGEYLLANPGQPVAPSLWGIPVAICPSLATGTALVLDASGVALLDRMQTVVQASRETGDTFTTNTCVVLAECRAGLAVFSPSAVLKVDLTAAE